MLAYRRKAAQRIGAVSLIAIAALPTSGCGGKDGSVQDAIRGAFATRDPAICTRYLTPDYLRLTYGGSYADALKLCHRNAPNPQSTPKGVRIRKVAVLGDRAIATVTLLGSQFNAQTFEAHLVNHDGWRVATAVPINLGNLTKPNFQSP